MTDAVRVQCPYCFEAVELWVDPDTSGTYVEDCAICCRPWQVFARRDERGELQVTVERAQ